MDSKKLQFERRGLLPGFAEGRFEAAPTYDPNEFARTQLEDPLRRDNRVNIRVSGHDMTELHRIALAEGLPLQSLLAQVVHQYANGLLQKIEATPVFQQQEFQPDEFQPEGFQPEEAGTSLDRPEP